MRARPSVLRISLNNATILSLVYLVVAAAAELLRRAEVGRWAERLALTLEAFPARVLAFLGLLEPLRGAYVAGHLSTLGVRVAYALTVVAVIFALGAAVGALMGLALPRGTGPSDDGGAGPGDGR